MRQGDVLSLVLFAIYMDVLIVRLRDAGYGCRLLNEFYGCLLYADDILLLVHSLNAMRRLLQVCEQVAIDLDVKFNSSKSVVLRTGCRYNARSVPLQLAGEKPKFVVSLKYLGICIKAFTHFKCSVEHSKLKFYRVFNCIFSRSKGENETNKMADVSLVLNDTLCFIVNKYGKVTDKQLKTILMDFYCAEDMSPAKNQLTNDIDKLSLSSKRPYTPIRRDCEGKLARDVDDIFDLLAFVDENKAMELLPKYVSSNPDFMPSLRLYEGDLNVIMSWLKNLSSKVERSESVLAAICRDVHAIQVGRSCDKLAQTVQCTQAGDRRPPAHSADRPTTADQYTSVSAMEAASGNPAPIESDYGRLLDDDMRWSMAITSTPLETENRFALLSTGDDDDKEDTQDERPRCNTVGGSWSTTTAAAAVTTTESSSSCLRHSIETLRQHFCGKETT